MSSPSALAASPLQHDTPNWAPLEHLVGLELCGRFMWMHAARLKDGRELHAYRHADTRRYLHLTAAGETFIGVTGEYVPVGLGRAIAQAFKGEVRCPPSENFDRTG